MSVNLSAGRTLAYNVLDIPLCRQGRFTVDLDSQGTQGTSDRGHAVHQGRRVDIVDVFFDGQVGIRSTELSQIINGCDLDVDVVILYVCIDKGTLRDRALLVFRGLSAFLISDDDERAALLVRARLIVRHALDLAELHGADGIVVVGVVVLDVHDVEGVLLVVGHLSVAVVVAVEDDELRVGLKSGLHCRALSLRLHIDVLKHNNASFLVAVVHLDRVGHNGRTVLIFAARIRAGLQAVLEDHFFGGEGAAAVHVTGVLTTCLVGRFSLDDDGSRIIFMTGLIEVNLSSVGGKHTVTHGAVLAALVHKLCCVRLVRVTNAHLGVHAVPIHLVDIVRV